MQELKDIKAEVTPTDTLLVVDAMTGQEAAQLTKAFDDAVNVTGVRARFQPLGCSAWCCHWWPSQVPLSLAHRQQRQEHA